MASFSPKQINKSLINGGNRFENSDSFSAEAINAPIEAALMFQSLATLPPNVTEIAYDEAPRVEIEGAEPRFHFYLPSNKAPTNWRDIRTLVRKGEISTYFSVGDQIETTWNDMTLLLDVIGINVDTPSDSNYKNSLTLQFHDIIAEQPYDTKGANSWVNSDIYAWLHGEFLHLLEKDLRDVLGRVTKTTTSYMGNNENSNDLVFFVSHDEIMRNGKYPYYEFYSGSDFVISRDKYNIVNPDSEFSLWWLRDWDGSTPITANAYHLGWISGAANYNGVCPAFCIW